MGRNVVIKKYIYFLLVFNMVSGGQPQWITQGIELTINNQFDEAIQVFSKACHVLPGDYRAHFYLAATLDSKMTHFENEADAAAFNAAIDSVIHLVKTAMAGSSTENAELIFYLGSAYGYRAYFLGRRGSWYSAIANGKKATALLQQAVDLDSTLYDAYLGIGTYKYWLYSKIKFITWLPFIPDERAEGIQMIRKPIDMNARSKYMAMHQLIYVLTDYKMAKEATIFADTLAERYPRSQFMLWAAAHAYSKNQDYTRAIIIFENLSRLLEEDPNPNPSHLIKCGYKLAVLYMQQSRYQACFAECTRVLQMIKKMHYPRKDKETIEELYKLREKSKKEIIAANDSLR
jgi:tetratricopeptide (TPR) repeat protein